MWGTGRFYLQKEMGQSQHSPSHTAPPCGDGRTHQHVPVPSRALPTAGWGNAASPRGAGTLRASCAVSPSFKLCFSPSHPNKEPPGAITGCPGAHHPPYPQGTALVCSGPSGGPSAPACWGRPACSRSWSRRSASLEGEGSIGFGHRPVITRGIALTVLSSPEAGLRFSSRRSCMGAPPLPTAGMGPPGRAASLQPVGERLSGSRHECPVQPPCTHAPWPLAPSLGAGWDSGVLGP